MKVLVISDTHGNIDNVRSILDQTEVVAVLHCGDYITDARLIQKFYPEVEVYGIYGNCDIGFGGEYDTVVTLDGVSIYMTHGHRYGVKWGEYEELIIDTKAHEAEIVVFGHSHEAHLEQKDGVVLLNPGSITKPRDSRYPSYAFIELNNGKIKEISILQIRANGEITRHPASYYKK